VSTVTDSGKGTTNKRPLVLILSVIAVLFLIVAVVYLAVPAKDLPGGLGHIKNGGMGKHDLRMAIAFVIAIACGAGAWWINRSSKTVSGGGGAASAGAAAR
jgi:uncharacterized membrane protein YphA (DoxX/SURF4 family)